MMQQEPEFEARIGDGELDSVIGCYDPRLRDVGVIVHVEHAPDRLIFQELVIHALGVRYRLLLPLLRGPHDRKRHALAALDDDIDERIPVELGELLEILFLGICALADDEHLELGLAERRAATAPALAVSSGTISHRSLFLQESEVAEIRDRSVSALDIAPLDVLFLARLEIRQGIQDRGSGGVLLRQPNLVASQRGLPRERAEQ